LITKRVKKEEGFANESLQGTCPQPLLARLQGPNGREQKERKIKIDLRRGLGKKERLYLANETFHELQVGKKARGGF